MSCAANYIAGGLRSAPPPSQGGVVAAAIGSTGRRISAAPPQLRRRRPAGVRCGIAELIGGDLVRPDLGRWLADVEEHKALAFYTPHEGGYEGRYLTRLRYQGYRFLDVSARGLGDPEATLTKIHPVCPVRTCPRHCHLFFFFFQCFFFLCFVVSAA